MSLDLAVIDVASGKSTTASSVSAGKLEEVCGKIDEAVEKLLAALPRQAIGPSAQAGRKAATVWFGTSPEAALWFYTGLHHWAAGEPESAETIRLLTSMLGSPNELARKLCAHALAKSVPLELPRDDKGLPTV